MPPAAVLALLLSIFWGAPVHANPACDVIAALGRIHSAAQSLPAAGAAARPRQLETIASELRRLDASNLAWVMRDHPLRDRIAVLAGLLDTAAASTAQWRAGRADLAAAVFATPAALRVIDGAGLLLSRHGCNDGKMARASGAGGATETSSDRPKKTDSYSNLRTVGIAAASSLAAIGFWGGIALLLRRQNRRRRLTERHLVNIVIRILGATPDVADATLLDLSRSGAKLRVAPGFPGKPPRKLRFALAGDDVTAAIRWRNAHYIGVEFQPPLSAEALRSLLASHHRAAPAGQTKSGTPKGAASDRPQGADQGITGLP